MDKLKDNFFKVEKKYKNKLFKLKQIIFTYISFYSSKIKYLKLIFLNPSN